MIKKMTLKEVKELAKDNEFIVIQGCGGSLNEYLEGMQQLFIDEGVANEDYKMEYMIRFVKNGSINLLIPLKDLKIVELAIFRLKIREVFGAMWLSDYVKRYL